MSRLCALARAVPGPDLPISILSSSSVTGILLVQVSVWPAEKARPSLPGHTTERQRGRVRGASKKASAVAVPSRFPLRALDLENGIHVLRTAQQEYKGAWVPADTGSHRTGSGLPISGLFYEREGNANSV